MIKLLAERLALSLLTLIGVAIIIFAGTEVLPGDVAQIILGRSATPEGLAALREKLGLADPAYIRFWNWLSDFVQGDLGRSLSTGSLTWGVDVTINAEVGRRLWNTIILAGLAALIALPPALMLGMIAAARPDSTYNRVINLFSLTAISMPEFFIAYVLIAVVAVQLGWFPGMAAVAPDIGFWDRMYVMTLPVLTLIAVVFAYILRMTRACVVDVLSHSYIEMAALKGLPTWRIVVEHALPNAVGPIANVIALTLAYLIVGVVVVEVVFVYPGMGQYLVDAVSKRDVPVVQACSMIFAAIYVGLNLMADVVAIVANPRLRYPK